jgi:hypothetical protein
MSPICTHANREFLLDGPTGIGKSSICLATFLTCFVRELPVLYMPRPAEWTIGCDNKKDAQIHIMKELFELNADLFLRNELFIPFFEEQFYGHSPNPKNYVKLWSALENREIPTVGFIVDVKG